jgi:hypothetical protein
MEDASSSPRVHSLVDAGALELLREEVSFTAGGWYGRFNRSPRMVDDLRLHTGVSICANISVTHSGKSHVLLRLDMP